MNADTLLQNVEILAEAPGGIDRLREAILSLATDGHLTEQDDSEPKPKFAHANGPSALPSNWVWTTLAEIASYGGSGNVSPSVIHPTDWVLDLEDIEKGTSRLIEKVIARQRPTRSNKTKFNAGDVLYGKLRPYLDKVLVADSQGYCTTEIVPIVPNQGIDPYWLRISLKSPRFLSYVSAKSYGMKMPRLGTKDALSSLHAVPPLLEQKRIVAKVDELMALCDLLEQQQRQRDNLRTATRRSAINAISTARTPEELETAWKRINNNWEVIADTPESIESLKELILAKHLLGESSHKGAWKMRKFGDLGTCRLGKMLDKAKNVGTPRGYLRNANVQWFRIDISDISQMKVRADDVAEYSLQPGDLLICEGGEPGRCAIVGKEVEGLLFQKALHRFRPNPYTNSKFVAYWLMLASKNGLLASRFTGVTIRHLTGQVLKNLEIAVPNIAEQNEVVESIDRLMALCDQLESELKSRSEVAEKFARSVVNAA